MFEFYLFLGKVVAVAGGLCLAISGLAWLSFWTYGVVRKANKSIKNMHEYYCNRNSYLRWKKDNDIYKKDLAFELDMMEETYQSELKALAKYREENDDKY